MVIAVVNTKGGVGKTTTSVNLAAALATPKRRVLLIDLDSQASASLWFGIARTKLKPSVASCLLHDLPLTKAIRPTRTPHLDLITGSVELANADLTLCDVEGRELTLRNTLQGIAQRYQFILLDCPPSLSLIGINALLAAEALLVPVTTQYLAMEGLQDLLTAVDQVRNRQNARARLIGIMLTMFDGSPQALEARERLRNAHCDGLLHTDIPISRALAEAPASHATIFEHAPRCRAADAYRRLAGEVLERVRHFRH